jgi:hypothetical protein
MSDTTGLKNPENPSMLLYLSRWCWTETFDGVQIKLVRYVRDSDSHAHMQIKLRHPSARRRVLRRHVVKEWRPAYTSRYNLEVRLIDNYRISVRQHR